MSSRIGTSPFDLAHNEIAKSHDSFRVIPIAITVVVKNCLAYSN
jgi:hypothetical protein